jgi:hypothetical protein
VSVNSATVDAQQRNTDAAKTRAEKAAVRILRPDSQGVLKPVAQGVLVPGGYILTAGHCINWEGTGAMALGDWYVETIQASDGAQHKVSPCAVEPMTDIAVLAAVDGQEMFEECHAFEEFCEATEPVPVSEDDFPGAKVKKLRVPKGRSLPSFDYKDPPLIPVHVLTHKGAWITGTAQRFGPLNAPPAGSVAVTFSAPIEGGTSGSPVIDDNGLLVGVISSSGEGPNLKASTDPMPRPHLALPVWVWKRIKLAATEGD